MLGDATCSLGTGEMAWTDTVRQLPLCKEDADGMAAALVSSSRRSSEAEQPACNQVAGSVRRRVLHAAWNESGES